MDKNELSEDERITIKEAMRKYGSSIGMYLFFSVQPATAAEENDVENGKFYSEEQRKAVENREMRNSELRKIGGVYLPGVFGEVATHHFLKEQTANIDDAWKEGPRFALVNVVKLMSDAPLVMFSETLAGACEVASLMLQRRVMQIINEDAAKDLSAAYELGKLFSQMGVTHVHESMFNSFRDALYQFNSLILDQLVRTCVTVSYFNTYNSIANGTIKVTKVTEEEYEVDPTKLDDLGNGIAQIVNDGVFNMVTVPQLAITIVPIGPQNESEKEAAMSAMTDMLGFQVIAKHLEEGGFADKSKDVLTSTKNKTETISDIVAGLTK